MSGDRKSNRKADRTTVTVPDCPCTKENLAVNLLEALGDEAVVAKLRKILCPDYDRLADVVAAKLSVRLKKLEDKLQENDELIVSLTKRLEEAENKLDDTEQYSRRTSVRIAGIPEESSENITDKASKVFEAMKLKPVINRVHRVGPKEARAKGPRPIICQFTTYPDKRAVMQAKKSIGGPFPGVFVNEDLTRRRSKVFFTARQLKRQGLVTEVWTADGRICIKDKKNRVHYVTRLKELDSLNTN